MSERKRSTKRRGNGEGSIFQRGDGRWVAKLTVGYDSNSKRLRKTVYGHTKSEVQDELGKLQQRKSTGALSHDSKVTVAQYLDRWLEDVARIVVRESTFARYKQLIVLHVKPRIGGVRLQRLTAGDVQGVYSAMEQGRLSPRTRQFVHAVLRMAMANAVKWGLLVRSVCDQVTAPRATKPLMKVWDAAQANAFLKTTEADRLYAMYALAISTGMRQGELLGLQWADVDLGTGRLSVRHTLTDSGKLAEPKTSKSRRLIELPGMAVKALWSHKKLALAEGNAASPFVFCDTQGGPLRRQNVLRRSYRPLLKKTKESLAETNKEEAARFLSIRFHDLRHTAATLMLKGGVHAKVVQEILGHANIAITLDTYSHVLPSMQKDAAVQMNNLLVAKSG